MKLDVLVGSGKKIGLLAMPFLVIGIILNILFSSFFSVGGPTPVLRAVSIIVSIIGFIIWIWSAIMVLIEVPQKKLMTNGPYALMKHPLYTAVALLLLPWVGFLLNTWLGALVGVVIYVGRILFAREEEALLSKNFGTAWNEYCKKVKISWL
jgi:protein-S-isoprenylcysteine O-methyltransferase Ste14